MNAAAVLGLLLGLCLPLAGAGQDAPEAAAGADPAPAGATAPVWTRVVLEPAGSFSAATDQLGHRVRRASLSGAEVLYLYASASAVDGTRDVRSFGLDGLSEALDAGESWSLGPQATGRELRLSLEAPKPLSKLDRRLGGARFETAYGFDLDRTRDGSNSLLLSASGSNTEDFRNHGMRLKADGGRLHRSLTFGLTVRLHVLPIEHSGDGRVFVQFLLSEQRSSAASGRQPESLFYYLSNEGEEAARQTGAIELAVPYAPEVWNELRFDLSADALEHIGPDRDLGLIGIRFGVQSRFQAPVSARFDGLEFERQLNGGAALAACRERVLALAGASSMPFNHFALLHDELPAAGLVELGPGSAPVLPELLEADAGAGSDLHRAVAAAARARGNAVALINRVAPAAVNEPLGPVLDRLERAMNVGADLLLMQGEAGTVPIQVALWDRLARGAGHAPALGSGGALGRPRTPLTTGAPALVSFVLAPPAPEEELRAAYLAGRTVFGDPEAFDGCVDLRSDRGFRMGQVVLTDRAEATVRLLRGAPSKGQVRREADSFAWVTAAGRWPERDLPSRGSSDGSGRRIELPNFARAEILGNRAEPVAFTNAIDFVERFPSGGLAVPRAAFDVGGVRSTGGHDVRLLGVEDRRGEESPGIHISMVAVSGGLELELDEDAPDEDLTGASGGSAPAVGWRFEGGLGGRGEQRGPRIVLTELSGTGTLVIEK